VRLNTVVTCTVRTGAPTNDDLSTILALSGPGGGVLSTTVLDLGSGVPVDFTFMALPPAGLSQLMFAPYGSDRDMMVAPPPFLGFTSYAEAGISVYCSPGPSLFMGAVSNCSVTLGSDPAAGAHPHIGEKPPWQCHWQCDALHRHADLHQFGHAVFQRHAAAVRIGVDPLLAGWRGRR
jgi:hypothetical protein